MTAPSLTTVYRQHHAFVWRTLRCLGVADAAVDDAVQDVFLVVHRRLDEFEGRSALRTWLYEIARRVAWRHRQRAQADALRSFELPDLHAAPDLDDAVARAQALEIVRVFLDRIDEDKAAVYVLAELGGLHGSEIAADLGVNVNTVHARLRAARRELERLLVRLRARDRSEALPRADRLAPLLVREQPSAEQQRRTWAALAVQLGLGASKLAWVVGGAVAVAFLGAASIVGQGRTEEPAAGDGRVQVSSRVTDEPDPAPREPSAASPATDPSAHPPAPAPAAPRPAPEKLVRSSKPTVSHAPAQPTATSNDALRRELALVEELRQARHAEPPRALELAARHRREHPRGALASEVAALEIEALCAKGDVAAAHLAAERFATRWPESSLRTSTSDPCDFTSR